MHWRLERERNRELEAEEECEGEREKERETRDGREGMTTTWSVIPQSAAATAAAVLLMPTR